MVDDQVHEAVVDDLRVSQQRIKELTRELNIARQALARADYVVKDIDEAHREYADRLTRERDELQLKLAALDSEVVDQAIQDVQELERERDEMQETIEDIRAVLENQCVREGLSPENVTDENMARAVNALILAADEAREYLMLSQHDRDYETLMLKELLEAWGADDTERLRGLFAHVGDWNLSPNTNAKIEDKEKAQRERDEAIGHLRLISEEAREGVFEHGGWGSLDDFLPTVLKARRWLEERDKGGDV